MKLIDFLLIVAICFLFIAWIFNDVPAFCPEYVKNGERITINRVENGFVHYDVHYEAGKVARTKKVREMDLKGWQCIKPIGEKP